MSLIEKLADLFEPLYEKIKGGYFGILVAVSGIIMVIICSILFYLAEPFTFYSHWISDLGGIQTHSGKSPNGSNIVFTISLLVICAFAVPYVVYFSSVLLEKDQKMPWLVTLGLLIGVITIVGIIGVAFFDIKSQPIVHTYFATIFFIGGMLIMLIYSLSMLLNSDIPKINTFFGFIMTAVPIIFLITFIPYILRGENPIMLVLSTDPALGISRFFEWMYLFALLAWFLETGLYTLKD